MIIPMKAAAKKSPKTNTTQKGTPKADFKARAAGEKAEHTATSAAAKQVKEELGAKLRSKGEIMAALKKGGELLLTAIGLFRLVPTSGLPHRVSKRRVSGMIAKGDLKLSRQTADGKFYVLAPVEEKKSEPKPESK